MRLPKTFMTRSALNAIVFALFAALQLSAGSARAAASDARGERLLDREAAAHFEKDEWKDAAPLFEQLYKDTHKPKYLWNLARCHHFLGENDEAIATYRRYLDEAPNLSARQKRQAKNFIAQLEFTNSRRDIDTVRIPPAARVNTPIATASPGATPPSGSRATAPPSASAPMLPIAPLPAAATSPDPTPDHTSTSAEPVTIPVAPQPAVQSTPMVATRPMSPRGSPRLRAAGLSLGAVGLVGLGAGLYFGLRTRSLSNQVSGASQFSPSDDTAGKTAHTLQFVMYGVGAAALLVGGIAYYAGRGTPEPAVAVAPVVGPSMAGALLQSHF